MSRSRIINNKYRKALLVASWGLVAACMTGIYLLSAATADLSSETSGGLLEWLYTNFGIELSQHFIRKCAHAFEYFVLCILLNFAFFFTFYKPCYMLSLFTAAFYSATDEIHQFFVIGRACQLRDVFVDCIGILAATAIIFLVFIICKKHKKER